MSDVSCQVRPISSTGKDNDGAQGVHYTIATLVNDRAQYDDMVSSFERGGFNGRDCEFLIIDNTGDTQTCAFKGLNAALGRANGRYVILCHQDVRLLDEGRPELDDRLEKLEALDPDWAVAGNAGGIKAGKVAIRISDPHGADQLVGALPARVVSVDENFIIVKRNSRVGFSNDLSGFHLYGADLCLNAQIMGWHAYVIDFHLAHLSPGKKDAAFTQMQHAFRDKWDRALRARFVPTTCTLLRIGGNPTNRLLRRIAEFVVHKAVRLGVHLRSLQKSAPERISSKAALHVLPQRGRDA